MKKHVEERRARNIELGKRDAENRCPICRRALPPPMERLYTHFDERPYCSEDCVGIAEERAKAVVI